MIVTCPKCEARYAVDPLAIGPSGRTVQCARCDNRWFQRVEGPPPPPDLVIRPPVRETASLPVPIEAKPEASGAWKVMAGIVGVVMLAGVLLGVYVLRDKLPRPVRDTINSTAHALHLQANKVIALLPREIPFLSSKEAPAPVPQPPARAAAPATTPPPSTATASPTPSPPPATTPPATTPPPAAATPPATTPAAAMPASPPASPAQLEVDLSASKIELVDGKYVVKGEIVNHGGTAGAPAKLTVQFKKGNEVLSSKSYPLSLGPVPPGDRQTFSQVLDNPPAGATDIVPSVE